VRALTDDDVAAFARRLGLPGIADIHVHFMPPRVMAAVWAYFDAAGPKLGRQWPVRYRGTDDERLALLRSFGVRRFAGLSYAHRPAMAAWLTDWELEFAARVPEAIATGTFFPEPDAPAYVAAAIERGVLLFKVHLQVGDFDPRDPLLDPVWGLLAEADVPVVVHAGSGPVPGRFTGPEPFGEVVRRHPRLPAIIAHFGTPQETAFVDLACRSERVALDTTMVGTAFMADVHALPREILPKVRDLGLAGRVFFGSDFPSIPYPFAHQVEVIEQWNLGEEWLRRVLWGNAVTRFGA
jgi:predicted TIM-barrel fold metal-dependent hydrolase